jgi:hypothetical protein
MAGPAINPLQVFRTGLPLHWEFLRLRTGFELPSSWSNLPCYGVNRKRNILDFMRWPHIGLGHRISTTPNGQNHFQKIAGSKFLDEYYPLDFNSHQPVCIKLTRTPPPPAFVGGPKVVLSTWSLPGASPCSWGSPMGPAVVRRWVRL